MPLSVDPVAGLVTQTLQEILGECNERLRELAGSDLDALDPDSPEGVLLGIWSERELILQGGLQDVNDALSVSNAQGAQLRNLAQSVGIAAIPASRSSVHVVFAGTPGTIINNVLFRHPDEGTLWRSPSMDLVVGAFGFVPGELTAVEPGPLEANYQTIFAPATMVAGVGNAVVDVEEGAQLGEADESDPDLRARILRTTGTEAGTEPAINAAMLLVPGATMESRVYVNRTLFIDPQTGLPPKSVEAVMVGGSEADIVMALYDSASISASYSGNITVPANTYPGVPIEVKYSRVQNIGLEVEATLVTTNAEVGLPAGYVADVQQAVGGVTLGVGRDAAPARFYAAVMGALPEGSWDEIDFEFRLAGSGDPLTSTYPIGIRERGVVEPGDVTVVVVP